MHSGEDLLTVSIHTARVNDFAATSSLVVGLRHSIGGSYILYIIDANLQEEADRVL